MWIDPSESTDPGMAFTKQQIAELLEHIEHDQDLRSQFARLMTRIVEDGNFIEPLLEGLREAQRDGLSLTPRDSF